MTTLPHPVQRTALRHAWLPRQHGAWAMLLLPLLLGVAASRPDGRQVVLGAAAIAGYLASATFQAWARARRAPAMRAPLLVYSAAFVTLGGVLVAAFPPLLLTLIVVVPAGIAVFRGARPGTRRDLVNSVAQVGQALVLVPAAAYIGNDTDPARVALYTLVAGGYLLGSVLVVRSVLRERGNAAFARLSAAFHLGLVVLALAALPPGYVLAATWLALRAIALPPVQRRWAGGPHPLRPIHVGMLELASSVVVLAVAFAVRL